MGGISQSKATLDEHQQLLWKGNVSLENNGGFASTRHALPNLDVSNYQGISLLVSGDEKTYKLNLANDFSSGSPRFQARFDLRAGLHLVYIPFQHLSASIRGNKVDAFFNPSMLKMVGFLIADQQEGPFHLSVKKISAYV